jgi:hypothetical protein
MVKSSANIDPITGTMYVARGHGYIMVLAAVFHDCHPQMPYECMGFINENNEYLTREEAFGEAMRCGQITKDDYSGRLFSEDIWNSIEPIFYSLPATERSKRIAKEVVDRWGSDQFAPPKPSVKEDLLAVVKT